MAAYKNRILRLETLENRELLAVTPGTADHTTLLGQKAFENNAIYVTTLQDSTNMNDGQISLREAINYANAGFDIRFLTSGEIRLNTELLISGKVNLVITASSVGVITVSGIGASRLMTVSTSSVHIESLNFTGGNSNSDNGGAIWIGLGSSISLKNASFYNNKAGDSGGAIYSVGNLTVSDSWFANNQAGRGGAIALLGGGSTNNPSAILNNLTLENNSATISGGSIFVNESTTSTQTVVRAGNLILRSNYAQTAGGAIFINRSILTLDDALIISNSTGTTGSGGAIYAANSWIALDQAEVINNTAANGGAFYLVGSTTSMMATVTSSLFQGNKATQTGGAVYIYEAFLLLEDSQFLNNQSEQDGGAVYCLGDRSVVQTKVNLSIYGSLFEGNSSRLGNGGAICNSGNTEMVNSRIIANSAYYSGAGIFNGVLLGGTKLDIQRSTIAENKLLLESSGASGAGIYNSNRASLICNDVLIWRNYAAGYGSGVYNMGDVGDVENMGTAAFYNSTITGNIDVAGKGAGLTNYGTITSYPVYTGNEQTRKQASNLVTIIEKGNNASDGFIDFGIVATSGAKITKTFVVTNISSQTLNLTSLSTIGVNTSQFSTGGAVTPITLLPGESREITLTFNPPAQPGFVAIELSWMISTGGYLSLGGVAMVTQNAANISVREFAANQALSNQNTTVSYTISLVSAPVGSINIVVRAGDGLLIRSGSGEYVRELVLTFTDSNYTTPKTISVMRDPEALAAQTITNGVITHAFVGNQSNSFLLSRGISDVTVPIASYVIIQEGCTNPNILPGANVVTVPKPLSISCQKTTYSSIPALKSLVKLDLDLIAAAGSSITEWIIDWGDGNRQYFNVRTYSLELSHYYSKPGFYSISVALVSANGTGRDKFFQVSSHFIEAIASELPSEPNIFESMENLLPIATSTDLTEEEPWEPEIFDFIGNEPELQDDSNTLISSVAPLDPNQFTDYHDLWYQSIGQDKRRKKILEDIGKF